MSSVYFMSPIHYHEGVVLVILIVMFPCDQTIGQTIKTGLGWYVQLYVWLEMNLWSSPFFLLKFFTSYNVTCVIICTMVKLLFTVNVVVINIVIVFVYLLINIMLSSFVKLLFTLNVVVINIVTVFVYLYVVIILMALIHRRTIRNHILGLDHHV